VNTYLVTFVETYEVLADEPHEAIGVAEEKRQSELPVDSHVEVEQTSA
jgi:hypothetical protein